MSERRSTLRRVIEFLSGSDSVTDADLDRGFKAAEAQHRPPPRPFELTFAEAVTSDLAREYWQTLGNASATLGGYTAGTLRISSRGESHDALTGYSRDSLTGHNVTMDERYDKLAQRVKTLERKVDQLMKLNRNP